MKSVMKNGSDDKKDWLVQLKLKIKGKWRTTFHKLGDEIKVGSDIYKITDINYEMKDIFNRKLKQPVPTNVSTIVIDKVDAAKKSPITVNIGKTVYENRVKIILQDDSNDKRIVTYVNGKIKLGNETLGTETYTVESIDTKKNIVKIISDDDKKEEFEIGKEPILDGIIADIEGKDEDAEKEDSETEKVKNNN
jgi:hypothetical protein